MRTSVADLLCLRFLRQVSICLECNSSKLRGLKRKWIRCSAQATVLHLKKFIAKKLNLTSFNEVRTSGSSPRKKLQALSLFLAHVSEEVTLQAPAPTRRSCLCLVKTRERGSFPAYCLHRPVQNSSRREMP